MTLQVVDKVRTSMVEGISTVLITRACDTCRKKKIKCEPTSSICAQCYKSRAKCHFTPIKVKRRPRRPIGQPRVDELERKLKEMEEQLRLATRAKLQEMSEISLTSSVNSVRPERPSRMGSLRTCMNCSEPNHYCKTCSTDFTREPLGISNSDQERNSSAVSLTDGFASLNENYVSGEWNLTPRLNLFTRRIFKPLPPKSEAIVLIHKTFRSFNSVFPIFDQDSCQKMVEYSEKDFDDPGWWACINVVLALAHRYDALRSSNNVLEDRKAWGYFQNALAVSSELSMLQSNLPAVQALLGMAIIVQGTPNTNPFSSLLSAAIKLGHQMGLHRKQQPPGLSKTDIELRKQVFWTSYFLDKDHSIRTGEPPNQDDDDMDTDLPLQSQESSPWSETHNNSVLFLSRIQLAKIQGQVHRRLGSVAAERKSVGERELAVGDLQTALHNWKATVPIDFDSEYFTPSAEIPVIRPIMHILTLRLSFFKTLNAIHHLSSPSQDETSDSVKDLKKVHHLPPPITCVAEARKAIKLLHVTPKEDYGCIWVILHIFVSATTTLLTFIISEPTSQFASSDLILIEPLLRILGALAYQEKSEEVAVMYRQCKELWDEAEKLVSLAEKSVGNVNMDEMRGRFLVQSRKPEFPLPHDRKESLEDFIRRIERISHGDDDMTGFRSFGA